VIKTWDCKMKINKVVDIFGNDTMTIVAINVGGKR